MIKRFIVLLVLLSTTLLQISCGSSANTSTTPQNSAASESEADDLSNNLQLTFALQLTMDADDDDFDITMDLDEEFTLPMELDADGNLRIQARSIPKMIHRVCATTSTKTGCNAISDALGGIDVDVVIDACGRLVSDDNCGNGDGSVFLGTLNDNGDINIQDVSIRMRAFTISGSTDGTTASDSDIGMLELPRLILDLTTGSTTAGVLSDIGSAVNAKNISLVSSGQLSSTVPVIGGAHFLARLTGTFDVDPFQLME